MLSAESARKIGVNACIEKLGRDFVHAFQDSSVASYTTNTEDEGYIFCFVGVDNRPAVSENRPDMLILDSASRFPYRASYNVSLFDGATHFLECVLPQ
ncbi:MAG: hypothetical protein IJ617_08895 [Oscillospiraceae bacterium]|nr:hypothetical protein [Oscillospiraceae bacterium]